MRDCLVEVRWLSAVMSWVLFGMESMAMASGLIASPAWWLGGTGGMRRQHFLQWGHRGRLGHSSLVTLTGDTGCSLVTLGTQRLAGTLIPSRSHLWHTLVTLWTHKYDTSLVTLGTAEGAWDTDPQWHSLATHISNIWDTEAICDIHWWHWWRATRWHTLEINPSDFMFTLTNWNTNVTLIMTTTWIIWQVGGNIYKVVSLLIPWWWSDCIILVLTSGEEFAKQLLLVGGTGGYRRAALYDIDNWCKTVLQEGHPTLTLTLTTGEKSSLQSRFLVPDGGVEQEQRRWVLREQLGEKCCFLFLALFLKLLGEKPLFQLLTILTIFLVYVESSLVRGTVYILWIFF